MNLTLPISNYLQKGLFLCLFAFLTAFFTESEAQSTDHFRYELSYLQKTLRRDHYSPRVIDDKFSEQVFYKFLEELDPRQMIFTTAEVHDLERYKTVIDDEMNDKSWTFLDYIITVYKKSLLRSETFIQDILKEPFSMQEKVDTLQLNLIQWAPNEDKCKSQWRLYLRYKTLDKLFSLKKRLNVKVNDPTFFNNHKEEIRKQVFNREIQTLHKALYPSIGLVDYVANIYLRSIASVFDPHTTYLSHLELMHFMLSVSTEGYSYGIALEDNEEDEVIISHLVPGGPAWKSGELHTSDVLTYIHRDKRDKKDSIDLYGMDADDITDLLEEEGFDTIQLTVRGSDGTEKTVKLRKEKIQQDENLVRSFLFRGKDKTIGYIRLPGFYSDLTLDGKSCANDVAKEIVKLMREHIDGLILDIRFNGGGSLEEAIDMAGIFIDQGPLGVLKEKDGNTITLKDNNRGTVYDGPLLLMVNKLSASASEFLAAALQDYNRAIIVGSPTYGKATAQQVVSVNPNSKELLDNTGSGYLKITKKKLYRVTGKTAQKKGVQPDITMPDVVDVLDIGESFNEFALSSDSLGRQTYFRPLSPLPVKKLKENAMARIDTSQVFRLVDTSMTLLEQKKISKRKIPLKWEEFVRYKEDTNKTIDLLESIIRKTAMPFEAINHASDLKRMEVDEFMVEMNHHYRENLSEDVYLAEAFRIICDYIKINNN